MSKRITRKQVVKYIGCPCLSLERSTYCGRSDYFVFVYDTHPLKHGEDRPANAIWATSPVYVSQLNHLSLDQWAETGSIFANEVEAQHA